MLENLIKKGFGIQEDAEPSPIGSGLFEQIETCKKYHSNLPNLKLWDVGSDHDIDKPFVENGEWVVPGGTSRTFYSVSRVVNSDGDVEECEIEFSIEDQFTPRVPIRDYYGNDVVVGSTLDCLEYDFEVVASRVGHMSTHDYEGEIFYSQEHEAWFFADEFQTF